MDISDNLFIYIFIAIVVAAGIRLVNKILARNLPSEADDFSRESSISLSKDIESVREIIFAYIDSNKHLIHLKKQSNDSVIFIKRKMSFTHAPKILEVLLKETDDATQIKIKCKLKYESKNVRQYDFGQCYKLSSDLLAHLQANRVAEGI